MSSFIVSKWPVHLAHDYETLHKNDRMDRLLELRNLRKFCDCRIVKTLFRIDRQVLRFQNLN